jgi:hypothetical protein
MVEFRTVEFVTGIRVAEFAGFPDFPFRDLRLQRPTREKLMIEFLASAVSADGSRRVLWDTQSKSQLLRNLLLTISER